MSDPYEEALRRVQDDWAAWWDEQASSPEGQRLTALHEALSDGLLAAMREQGWEPDPATDVGVTAGVVGSFRCRINDDFAATALFAWFGDDYPPLRVDTVIGVSYERSYRAWPLLLDHPPHSEVRTGLPEVSGSGSPVELRELDEVVSAVRQLVSRVVEFALPWALPMASVDAVLEALRDDDDEITELADVPVVLAASGRVDEARRALEQALQRHSSEADDRYWKRFVSRFETWIADGAGDA